jgi:hypothetical protein
LDGTQRAGALAFYTLFSLARLVVILVTLIGIVFGAEAARGEISSGISGLIGAQPAEAVEEAVRRSRPAYGVRGRGGLALPAGIQVARLACPGAPVRDNPQTSCRGWSPPVRLRYTRNSGRAQQRNINAATGSSVVSSRIHLEPNHRSAFS